MEQEKKPAECSCEKCKCECCKCGKGLKIAVVFTTILALAGAGFGVYGMFFKKDAQPAPVAKPEAEVEEGKEWAERVPTRMTVSYAQYFLNQKLKLPKYFGPGVLSYGDTLTESDKAMIIRDLGDAKETKDKECQTGAYITREEYETLYKSLFGADFVFDPNEAYSTRTGHGYFSDKPCTCEESCDATAVENGYFQWNNTYMGVRVNYIVESVDEHSIYGKTYTLYDGQFDESSEPQLSGKFEIKYAKNDDGYYITAIKKLGE